jgi:hypothetical protein
LPVEYQEVAPDGLSYILHGDPIISPPADPAAFYLVDVKTGKRQQVLGAGPPQAPGSWQVIDYTSAGIYLWSAGIQPVPGLWLLNPVTGGVRQIDNHAFWSIVGPDAAWSTTNVSPGAPEDLLRLDLQSHRIASWFRSTANIVVFAADPDGGVLIGLQQADGTLQLGRVSGPDTFEPFAVPANFPTVDAAYVRHPGVWLALRGGGLALYTHRSGIQWLTRSPSIFDVAGGCW